MIELISPMPKGKIIRMKFTSRIEINLSENLLSFSDFSPKSRVIYSADIKSEIKADTNEIITENSNPIVPIREKGVSIKDAKTIRISEIRNFFENNISVNIARV
jgi:hypothetical protein